MSVSAFCKMLPNITLNLAPIKTSGLDLHETLHNVCSSQKENPNVSEKYQVNDTGQAKTKHKMQGPHKKWSMKHILHANRSIYQNYQIKEKGFTTDNRMVSLFKKFRLPSASLKTTVLIKFTNHNDSRDSLTGHDTKTSNMMHLLIIFGDNLNDHTP